MKKKKRKNLKFNISNFYVIIAVVFVLGFGFFGTSKLYFAEDVPLNQTELNQEFDLRSNGKFSINSWTYDDMANKMEVILVTDGMKNYLSDLNFSSVSRKNVQQELPVEVVFNDNEIYILHIGNVPKDFEQIAIRLHKTEKSMEEIFEESKEEKQENKILSTIYTDERVVEREVVEVKDERDYTRQITDSSIKQSELSKEKFNEKIKIIESVNTDLLNEIELLKKDLLYQTVNEQIETNNEIYKLERDVESNKKDIENLQIDIKSMDMKIERLNQKKRDIGI